MNIKRYFAPDIKQAIRMVREEQGADAVILSNRKVDGGVEIVAARDFDEQLLQDGGRGAPEPQVAPENGQRDARRRAEDVFHETLGGRLPDVDDDLPPAPAPQRPASRPAAANARPQGAFHEINPPRIPPARNSVEEVPAPRRPAAPPQRPAAARAPQCTAEPAVPKTETRTAPRPAAASTASARQPGGQAAALREALRGAVAESALSPDEAGDRNMDEMYRELKQMRRMLDMHFTQAGFEAAQQRSPTRLDLMRKLSAAGFSRAMSRRFAEQAGTFQDFEPAFDVVRGLIAREIPLARDNLLEHGGVVALVGPTGVGKTTTIAKLAARFRLKHGPRQVALITTDNYRIAAHEQLSTYGRILDVPVRVASSTEELRHLLAGFYDRRLVLIDTAGMGQRDQRLAEQAALFAHAELPIKSYLVLSAASQLRVTEEAIDAFQAFAPEACVLTKLDETVQLGAAVSAVTERKLPMAFLCDGQQVPEDLHAAGSQLLLERCFAESTDAETPEALPLADDDWVAHAHF